MHSFSDYCYNIRYQEMNFDNELYDRLLLLLLSA